MKTPNSATVARIDEMLSRCGTHGDHCMHCEMLQLIVEEIWTVVKAALA
jgi:hypothetical protein